MECFAGAAAVGGLGAREVFDYNRENFMYDRRLRLKKELKLQEFRVAQAKLWREDVRDLISLTEYKMHVYLLVNVLMLGFTIILYTEGKLPSHTPSWLMNGYVMSITGSFMFLLLSIWLAMQAAVAAQSYEARLLTQLVRLPIPSWQEIEACRTYGSEFEQAEPRQMFRVPFVTGRQEGLVRGSPARTPTMPDRSRASEAASDIGSEPGDSDTMSTDDVAASSSVGSRPSMSSPSIGGAAPSLPAHADPWGLERRGDNIYELGCKHGHDVAKLRHILLARHAMVYWQTYDAFARVSLSIGTNQLLLAMSYYIIGYIMVEVGCPTSATYGVLLFTVMAETLTRLDMSLSLGQLRFLQVLLLIGPVTSCIAGLHWTKNTEESSQTAETLIVLAFFSHSMYLALMSHFCKIRAQDNGAMMPTAFRSVLYLDVFGWLKLPQHDEDEIGSAHGSLHSGISSPVLSEHGDGGMAGAQRARPSYYASAYRGLNTDGSFADGSSALLEDGVDTARPALAAMKYQDGRPVPQRPEDMAPSGAVQDMRGLPEAAQPKRLGGDAEDTEFYSAASWLHSGSDDAETSAKQESWLGPIKTGHEKQPGALPWWIFSFALRALCLAWAASAVYHALGASQVWNFDNVPEGALLETARSKTRHSPSWLGLADFGGLLDRERVHVAWPYPDLEPRSLACDASGKHFVVSDGLTIYTADLQKSNATSTLSALRPAGQNGRLRLQFRESPCSALTGEGLQDVALMCGGIAGDQPAACTALVLYQQGRRMAACSLSPAGELHATEGADNGLTADIATDWLERFRSNGLIEEANGQMGGRHGRIEKAVAVTFDAECRAQATEPAAALRNCTIVGTTRGRVVRLQRQVEGEVLIPVEALNEKFNSKEAPLRPGGMRALHDGSLSILEATGQNIQVVRGSGGARVSEFLPPPVSPTAAFCVGGGHLYALGEGPSPTLWRARLPR